jgi:hypothetical protein
MTEKKTKEDEPITADELLAMDSDELHQWVSRKLAERIAAGEQRAAEERSGANEDETG